MFVVFNFILLVCVLFFFFMYFLLLLAVFYLIFYLVLFCFVFFFKNWVLFFLQSTLAGCFVRCVVEFPLIRSFSSVYWSNIMTDSDSYRAWHTYVIENLMSVIIQLSTHDLIVLFLLSIFWIFNNLSFFSDNSVINFFNFLDTNFYLDLYSPKHKLYICFLKDWLKASGSDFYIINDFITITSFLNINSSLIVNLSDDFKYMLYILIFVFSKS